MVINEKPTFQSASGSTAAQRIPLRKRLLINLKSLAPCPFCLEIIDLFNNVIMRFHSQERDPKIIDLNLENIEQGSYLVKIKSPQRDTILQHIHV